MNLRYRLDLEKAWRPIDEKKLVGVLKKLRPTESVEVRRQCDHSDTWNDSGIRTCKTCGEQLEVTSWRD